MGQKSSELARSAHPYPTSSSAASLSPVFSITSCLHPEKGVETLAMTSYLLTVYLGLVA